MPVEPAPGSLRADSEMAVLTRDFPWAATPLGAREDWPLALRLAVANMLASPRSMALFWGPDLVLLYNDACKRMIGTRHPTALGRPGREALSELWEDARPHFEQVVGGGTAVSVHASRVHIRRGGDGLGEGWFNLSFEPVFDADGTVGGVLVPVEEVTDWVLERLEHEEADAHRDELAREVQTQLRAVEAQRDQDALFRRIANAAPAILWVTDTRGACLFTSQSWYEFTGAAPGTALGFGWLKSLHPADLEDTREELAEAFRTRSPFQIQHRLQFTDGTYRWVLDSGRPRLSGDGTFEGYAGSVIDIHDWKRAQGELQQTQERNTTLVSAMDEGFCVVEMLLDAEDRPLDYRHLEVNPAFTQQSGIEDATGTWARDLLPNLEPVWLERFAEVVLTGEPVRFQAESSALGRWFDAYAFPVDDPETRRLGVLFRDITQQVREEEALRKAAERVAYRARLADALRMAEDADAAKREASRLLGELLGAARVAIGDVDEAGTIATVKGDYTRPGLTSIEGEHRLDRLGFVMSRFRLSGAIAQSNVEELRVGEGHREAYRQLGIVAHVTVPLVRRGRLRAFCTVTDIEPREWDAEEISLVEETAERTWTAIERARAERALRASEERFRRLADSMPQLVWTAGVQGEVQYYNRRGDLYDGLARGVDDHWAWQPVLHHDDRPRTVAAWRTAVESGEPYECEHRVKMRDGTYRWHLSRAERVETDGIPQWYGTATDIHELKMADELKDRFLAIASHELRNPVGVIHGTAQQIRRARRLGTLTEERFEAYVDSLIRTTTHLANLTSDLTDVSRLQRGALPLRLAPTDLARLVREITSPEDWRSRIRLDVEVEQAFVLADEHRVRQVLTNLVDNALKYSPAESMVDVRLARRDDGVLIDVEDRGIGLSSEDIVALFTPFGRASNAGTVPGLGMGLFIAREVALRHGGDLQARSDGPGCGVTMSFWLPAAGAGTAPEPAEVL